MQSCPSLRKRAPSSSPARGRTATSQERVSTPFPCSQLRSPKASVLPAERQPQTLVALHEAELRGLLLPEHEHRVRLPERLVQTRGAEPRPLGEEGPRVALRHSCLGAPA